MGIPRPSRLRRVRAELLELLLYVVLGAVLFLPGLALLANDATVIGVLLIALALIVVVTVSVRRNRSTDA